MSTVTEQLSPTHQERLEFHCGKQGLIFLGVTRPEYPADFSRFLSWIGEKRHAELRYLENHQEVRRDPRKLLDGSKTAIIVALPYFQEEGEGFPRVAQYARYVDYHRVLREKAERVAEGAFPSGSFRVTVDSAPLLERALAARTAQGFIGKNTLYIHPKHGSFLLLGEILTTQELQIDEPPSISLKRKTKEGGCGPCQLCQVACPTGALDRSYSMDASRCLSYWTIENRGTIPENFWPYLAQYYFGCDLCQLACPYNIKASPAPADWEPRKYPSVDRVAEMNQAEYEQYFGGTPLTRAKRNGLRRNALIAMAVTRHPGLVKAINQVAVDPDPVLEKTVEQIKSFLSNQSSALAR